MNNADFKQDPKDILQNMNHNDQAFYLAKNVKDMNEKSLCFQNKQKIVQSNELLAEACERFSNDPHEFLNFVDSIKNEEIQLKLLKQSRRLFQLLRVKNTPSDFFPSIDEQTTDQNQVGSSKPTTETQPQSPKNTKNSKNSISSTQKPDNNETITNTIKSEKQSSSNSLASSSNTNSINHNDLTSDVIHIGTKGLPKRNSTMKPKKTEIGSAPENTQQYPETKMNDEAPSEDIRVNQPTTGILSIIGQQDDNESSDFDFFSMESDQDGSSGDGVEFGFSSNNSTSKQSTSNNKRIQLPTPEPRIIERVLPRPDNTYSENGAPMTSHKEPAPRASQSNIGKSKDSPKQSPNSSSSNDQKIDLDSLVIPEVLSIDEALDLIKRIPNTNQTHIAAYIEMHKQRRGIPPSELLQYFVVFNFNIEEFKQFVNTLP